MLVRSNCFWPVVNIAQYQARYSNLAIQRPVDLQSYTGYSVTIVSTEFAATIHGA